MLGDSWFAPGWHRKWLILLTLLGWLYLFRFRLMGALLSKVISYHLAKKKKNATMQLEVQIHQITWQPLRFTHVEVQCRRNEWRFVFSSITIHSHVREFFRCFTQKKLWVVEIEDVRGDVKHLDEETLRDMLKPPSEDQTVRTSGPNASCNLNSSERSSQSNPMGFFRFVDIQVRSVEMQVHCFGIRTQVMGRKLSFGITDVFVEQNLLYLQMQAAHFYLRSVPDTSTTAERYAMFEDAESFQDGLRIDVKHICFMFHVQLSIQRAVGCKVFGSDQDVATLQVCATFVELVLAKRLELVRKGIIRSGKSRNAQQLSGGPLPDHGNVWVVPISMDISKFHFMLEVVNGEHPESRLRLSADILEMILENVLIDSNSERENSHLDVSREASATPKSCGVTLSAVVYNLNVKTSRDLSLSVLSATSIEIKGTQSQDDRGKIDCAVGSVESSIDTRVTQVIHALLLVNERVDALNKAITALLSKENVTTDTHVNVKSLNQIEWDLETRISSWSLTMIPISLARSQQEEMALSGHTTLFRTTLCQRRRGPVLNSTYSATIGQIYMDITRFSSALSCPKQSLLFSGASITIRKILEHQTVSNYVSVGFKSVSVNGVHKENAAVDNLVPSGYLIEVSVEREEIKSAEGVDVRMVVLIEDTDVCWSHPQYHLILSELDAIEKMLNKIEGMVTRPSTNNVECQVSEQSQKKKVKNLLVNAHLRKVQLRLVDIRGVAPLITFDFADSNLEYEKTQSSLTMRVKCAISRVKWGDVIPVIEVTEASFHQKKLLEPQIQDSPVQNTIKVIELKVYIHPQQRLLLLFLRLDELAATTIHDESRHVEQPVKKPTRQDLSLDCNKITVAIHERSDVAVAHDSVFLCALASESFQVNTVISKSYDITEPVTRFIQSNQRGQVSACHPSKMINQVLNIEGTISVKTLTLLGQTNAQAKFQETNLQFSLTEVSWNTASANLSQDSNVWGSRTALFDVSIFTNSSDIAVQKKEVDAWKRSVSVVQQAFNTIQVDDVLQDTLVHKATWRMRYMGNFDVAVRRLAVVVPYGSKHVTIGNPDASCDGIGEKCMRIILDEMTLTGFQFQKMMFRVHSFRIMLEDAKEQPALEIVFDASARQFVYLPRMTIRLFIHWQEEVAISPLLPQIQEYTISLEVTLQKGHGSPVSSNQPQFEEALVALNWDYVYPLFIFMGTDDEDCEITDPNAVSDLSNIHVSDHSPAQADQLRCTDIRWDASVDVVQIAWWDGMTQDLALLAVGNDILSHGILRNMSVHEKIRSMASEDTRLTQNWILWESIVYVDEVRGYLLHNADGGSSSTDEATTNTSGRGFPFDPVESSLFFLEMIGISYRVKYISEASDDEMDDHVESEFESLFRELDKAVGEKWHKHFSSIYCDFMSFDGIKSSQQDSLSMVHSIPMISPMILTPSRSPPILSPSTPRSKSSAQTVRNKLFKFKRRKSSMDNLLLNDGSRPIQVDSMKLLWTIETRDSVFHMIAVVIDSIELLVEAKQQQQQGVALGRVNAVADIPSEYENTKASSTRRASLPQHNMADQLRGGHRRGSTRETLLDLLQQGKLGVKQTSSSPDLHNTSGTADNMNPNSSGGVGGETEDESFSKSIAFKKYTVDVHDAQINMREEGTRSNVLVASKHIHLEFGLDECQLHTIAKLKFDLVTAHVPPIGVDLSTGVLWYSHGSSLTSPRMTPLPSSSSSLLQQVMDECSVTTTYSQAIASGATAVTADLSFIQLLVDRHQFYQLLNVIRHVLLAPPAVAKRTKRAATNVRGNITELNSLSLELSELQVYPPSPSIPSHHSAKKIHSLLLDELRSREARFLGTSLRINTLTLKSISFRAEGSCMRLRASPEITGLDHEFAEVRVEGITGSHTFYSNQCTKFTMNLQWIEINNLRPGPSSIAFEDAMSVLKAKLLVDKRYQSIKHVNLANQKGMLTVRAESGPLTRVLGQKLRVLDVLEVSIFPEIPNMIIIQLAADFYELVYKFFFEQLTPDNHHDGNSEHLFFGRKGMVSPTGTGMSSPPLRNRAVTSIQTSSIISGTTPKRKSIMVNTSTSTNLVDPITSAISISSSSTALSVSTSTTEISTPDDDDASTEGCELFYFKYVRVGNVHLRINCNGFFVNLNNFDLDLPPYVCQSKLCTWKKLLQKFESHLKWYVTKESASSGLSHFKNKLLKWTPSSSSEKKDKQKKEEDSAILNAQVLFGPYSGAQT